MTYEEILTRAFKYKDFVYWYGGKGQKCTEQLLQTLASQNPSVWTQRYKEKARRDIAAGKSCIDCSGLVCKAYGIQSMGSYFIHDTFKKLKPEEATAGMVLWKPGHVAIVVDENYIIEAKGIDYDVCVSKRENNSFKAGLYLEGYTYDRHYAKGWHTDNLGTWYAYGEHQGCYYKDCLAYIEGKPYYFDRGGYVV